LSQFADLLVVGVGGQSEPVEDASETTVATSTAALKARVGGKKKEGASDVVVRPCERQGLGMCCL